MERSQSKGRRRGGKGILEEEKCLFMAEKFLTETFKDSSTSSTTNWRLAKKVCTSFRVKDDVGW